MDQRAGGIRSVEKAIAILRSFDHQEPELGVMELSRRLRLHKSSVSRLLSTLEQGGLVERNPETGRYRLGVELIALAGLVVRHADLRAMARLPLEKLAEDCSETVNLAVWDQGMAMNIEQFAPAEHQVKDFGWVGRRTPLHATSVGKVLLAYLPPPEEEKVLRSLNLQPLTSQTIVDRESLRHELDLVRHQGYATGIEELEIGLNSVAAPVRDYTGAVIAAVSISGPEYRVRREYLSALAVIVMETAGNISRMMGWDSSVLGVMEQDRIGMPAL